MFKTIMIAAFLILMTLIWINRERVYLRDPIATVYRDGVEQSGVQVFQNYSNDVLIEKDSDPAPYRILIQGWNQVPGTPAILRCMRWMACLAEMCIRDRDDKGAQDDKRGDWWRCEEEAGPSFCFISFLRGIPARC